LGAGGALKNHKAGVVVNICTTGRNRTEIGNLDATTVKDNELYGYGALRVGLASGIVS
jgi:hypothetical protein